ncbi:MAG: DUF4129 domain-containing protein [Dehalococcoidia bacterium]|nr:DUF4129 domain-containing protein [Dehalococcoidia bacterium]MCB9485289.1 DUF4129 domain-containing protein [Thermoflexaceae bacterium]
MIGRVAIATAVASEALAFYTVAEWFAAGFPEGRNETFPALTLVALALIAFSLPRAVQALELKPGPSAAVIGIVAYVVLYGLIRLQFSGDFAIWNLSWMADFVRDPGATLENRGSVVAGVLIAIAVWARASLRSGQDIELAVLVRSVTVPFVIVTAVVALSAYSDRVGIVARGGAAYYVVAIVSLAFAQLSLSGATFGELRAGGTVVTLLAATLGAAAACVVVFWLVFGIVGPIIGPIIEETIFIVLTAILTPIAWVLEFILSRLLGDATAIPDITVPDAIKERAGEDPHSAASPAERGGIYAARIFMLVLGLVILAGVVAFHTRLRRRMAAPAVEGDASSLGGAFTDDLSGLLRSMFRRGHATPSGTASSEARRLYLAMVEQARKDGIDRDPADTPEEIVPRVAAVYEPLVAREITDAFIQSRYAGREPDPARLAELQRRWAQRRS